MTEEPSKPSQWQAYCACGGIKRKRSPRCRRCYLSARMAEYLARAEELLPPELQLEVPDVCECNQRGEPTPWHCDCGRWKPSSHLFCEICVAA